MPFNGAGSYSPPAADFPAVANTLIESAHFNNIMNDIATALSTCITKDGQQTITANIPMNGFVFTGLGSGIASRTRSASIADVQDGLSNWIVAAGTADAITATYSPAITALVDGQVCSFRALLTNLTTTPTFAPNGLTARTITRLGGGPLQAGDIAGVLAECILRYNLANTRWELLTPAKLNTAHPGSLINGTIVATRAGSAETIAVKTLGGSDPSPADPVLAVFRDTAATTGGVTVLPIVAALSLTISSGSTLGMTNAVAAKPWVVVFNDAGTARLGIINCLSGVNIYPLGQQPIASSTAEGGAGAADSAQVFYTGTAVAAKAYCIAGYLEYTLAAVGTWNTAPSKIQVYGAGVPLPGAIVQSLRTGSGASSTGTTRIPLDNTTPQSGEGDQYFSQAVTPTSPAHLLGVSWEGVFSDSGNGSVTVAIFQDAGANAIATSFAQVNGISDNPLLHRGSYYAVANLAVATTFKLRAGSSSVGTTRLNNVAGGGAIFNGTLQANLTIVEVVT